MLDALALLTHSSSCMPVPMPASVPGPVPVHVPDRRNCALLARFRCLVRPLSSSPPSCMHHWHADWLGDSPALVVVDLAFPAFTLARPAAACREVDQRRFHAEMCIVSAIRDGRLCRSIKASVQVSLHQYFYPEFDSIHDSLKRAFADALWSFKLTALPFWRQT